MVGAQAASTLLGVVSEAELRRIIALPDENPEKQEWDEKAGRFLRGGSPALRKALYPREGELRAEHFLEVQRGGQHTPIYDGAGGNGRVTAQ